MFGLRLVCAVEWKWSGRAMKVLKRKAGKAEEDWRFCGDILPLRSYCLRGCRLDSGVNQLAIKIFARNGWSRPCLLSLHRVPPEFRMNLKLKRRLAQLFHEPMRHCIIVNVLVAYCQSNDCHATPLLLQANCEGVRACNMTHWTMLYTCVPSLLSRNSNRDRHNIWFSPS